MLQLERFINQMVSAVLFTALTLLIPTSCDIYESLPPCPRGVKVQFVYDYNMEFADAFRSQVDCLTLLVYDNNERLVTIVNEEGEPLKKMGYNIPIDLEHGKYHLVAFGGLTCEKRSFEPLSHLEVGSSLSELKVALKQTNATSANLLHPFFHAAADVIVDGEMYKDVTLHFVKNTNNIRILLQQTNGTFVDANDFDFCIQDDNSLFDADNQLIPNGGITYLPWSKGNATADKTKENTDIHAAYAEFSTSRLSADINNRLQVKLKKDGSTIIDLPLNDILLMLKSDQYGQMKAQEFLDRENNWSLVFFLSDGGLWITTHIIVNGWTVRLNDTEL